MRIKFHEGELLAKDKAGFLQAGDREKTFAREDIPDIAKIFIEQQTMALVTTVDEEGSVWVSALWGKPGFITVVSPKTIIMDPIHGHFLESAGHLTDNNHLGLLLIDFAERRRMRVNGICEISSNGHWKVSTEEVYSNCPKYIQPRRFVSMNRAETNSYKVTGTELPDYQQEFIRKADTFFIGSFSPKHGADASHRGGESGFVDVPSERKLIIPDYKGNKFFNTIGNLLLNPKCGLMFIDFERGHTLRLSGIMKVNWDPNVTAAYPGAERVLEFTIQSIIEQTSIMPGAYVE